MDDDTVRRIYALFSMKVPTKQICAETGQPEPEIKRMRRAWRDAGRPAAPATVGEIPDDGITPARVESRVHTRVIEPFQSDLTPETMKPAVLQGIADTINFTIMQLQTAAEIPDNRERIYATTQYLKILSSLYARMGTWAGLDTPPEDMSAHDQAMRNNYATLKALQDAFEQLSTPYDDPEAATDGRRHTATGLQDVRCEGPHQADMPGDGPG